jgi:hypothetical protein
MMLQRRLNAAYKAGFADGVLFSQPHVLHSNRRRSSSRSSSTAIQYAALLRQDSQRSAQDEQQQQQHQEERQQRRPEECCLRSAPRKRSPEVNDLQAFTGSSSGGRKKPINENSSEDEVLTNQLKLLHPSNLACENSALLGPDTAGLCLDLNKAAATLSSLSDEQLLLVATAAISYNPFNNINSSSSTDSRLTLPYAARTAKNNASRHLKPKRCLQRLVKQQQPTAVGWSSPPTGSNGACGTTSAVTPAAATAATSAAAAELRPVLNGLCGNGKADLAVATQGMSRSAAAEAGTTYLCQNSKPAGSSSFNAGNAGLNLSMDKQGCLEPLSRMDKQGCVEPLPAAGSLQQCRVLPATAAGCALTLAGSAADDDESSAPLPCLIGQEVQASTAAASPAVAALFDELLASSGIDSSSLETLGQRCQDSPNASDMSTDWQQQWQQPQQQQQQQQENWHSHQGWQHQQLEHHQALMLLPAATASSACDTAAVMLGWDKEDGFVPPSLTELLMAMHE